MAITLYIRYYLIKIFKFPVYFFAFKKMKIKKKFSEKILYIISIMSNE